MLQKEIIEFMLSKKYKPMKEDELIRFFPNYSKEEIRDTLKAMRENYLVMTNKNGNNILATKMGLYTGVVTGVFENYIFVKLEQYEKDFRIKVEPGTVVLPKDEVLIHLGEDETFKKVIRRNIEKLAGEVVAEEIKEGVYKYYVVPYNKKLNNTFRLSPEQCKNLVNGHVVIFELVSTKLGTEPVIKEIVGYKDDPKVDILAHLKEADVPTDFSEESIEEANAVAREVNEDDLKNRTDFRDRMIFTIDGADAKDFDDAVEVYPREDGGFKIGVHIADVSEFVKEGGALDKEAESRGNSIYLAYSVVPMLPQILSNGCCSLLPHKDRLTMSFLMEIDKNGNLEGGDIKLGVINSKKRWTYDEVNKIVEQNDQETIEKNKQFIPMINAMIKASEALRANKNERGQLELGIPEAKIIANDQGKVIDVVPRYRGLAEKAIEDLMVLTNEFVASTILNMGLPSMYRIHEDPNEFKIEHFMSIAKSVGHSPKNRRVGYSSHDIKNILEGEKDELLKAVLASLLLRSLPKARYSPHNAGHFGLASDAYTHVTSPIRRYVDLIVHRLIKLYFFEPEKFAKIDFDKLLKQLEVIGHTTSSQEKVAEQLERDVDDMFKAAYMEDKVGNTYTGKISGFTDRGMFVQLTNTIEGYIKFDYLKDDVYVFDRNRMIAEGKKNKRVLRLGSEFEVKVARASKRDAQIDFVPANYKIDKSSTKKKNIPNKRKGRRHG